MTTTPAEWNDPQLLGRLISISDGVFAVALTLLILNIVAPHISQGQVQTELPSQLLHLLPNMVAYVFSFFVISLFWVAHYRVFHYIRRSDRTLISLNAIFLLSVTFIPFPTSLVSEYGLYQLPWVIYAGSMAVTGSLLTILWLYSSHDHRLIDPDLDSRTIRRLTEWRVAAPVAFVISIVVSFLSVPAAQVIALSVFISQRLLERLRPLESE